MGNQEYERSPTIEEIEFIVKMSGMNKLQFERFYGMSAETIRRFKKGASLFPRKYWHLFFDPPKPIRDKIDAVDYLRQKCQADVWEKKFIHKPRFKPKNKKEKEQKQEVKKIGVLADLLR